MDDYPTNKTALIELIVVERAKLEGLLASMSDEQLTTPNVEGELTIKDLLAHIAAWEQSSLRRLAQAARGEPVPRLAAAGEDAQKAVDQINAQVYAANRDRPLAEVQADFQRSFQDLGAALNGYSEAQIFDEEGLARYLGFMPIELIAGDSYEHYREHAASIMAWLNLYGG
jgi:hypothetical protein